MTGTEEQRNKGEKGSFSPSSHESPSPAPFSPFFSAVCGASFFSAFPSPPDPDGRDTEFHSRRIFIHHSFPEDCSPTRRRRAEGAGCMFAQGEDTPISAVSSSCAKGGKVKRDTHSSPPNNASPRRCFPRLCGRILRRKLFSGFPLEKKKQPVYIPPFLIINGVNSKLNSDGNAGSVKVGKRILDGIDSPEALKKLTMDELNQLSREIHSEIIEVVARNGGHLAPNLGVTDLTIALHRVFDMPRDKIIFDVGHQSYPHKLLTGRRKEFHSIRKEEGLSGFTKADESAFDPFGAGHAGTAISAAMGFAAARDLNGTDEHIVALLGDGALGCGISLEAMNNVRSSCRNLIIVLNDNKMSISRSTGAIPNYLNSIITGRNYNRFKAFTKMSIERLPGGGEIVGSIQKLETSLKSLFVPGLFFEAMGLRYIGPINGHQLPELIETFERVKKFNRPVLVHVITEKGHGCEYAKDAPEKFHGVSSFNPENGALMAQGKGETFSSAFGEELVRLAEKDSRIVGITAAMCAGTGMTSFAAKFHDRFFDVGIAEEHALVFAAGLAAAGKRPVVAIYATFLQRALDCVFHDICLQNLPVVICADRAGIVEDGPTHHGIYDLSFLQAMPNLSILAPRNERELKRMLQKALEQENPVLIRYPRGGSGMTAAGDPPPSPLEWGRAEILRPGSDLAIWTFGREARTALKAADLIREKTGREVAVVNARFLKPFDRAQLEAHAALMPIVTLEDHVKTGGLASIAESVLVGIPHHGLLSFGWKAEDIIQHGSPDSLRKTHGMSAEQIAESATKRFFSPEDGHSAILDSSPVRNSPGKKDP